MDSIDRQIVLSLEQVGTPCSADIAHAARLVLRYEGSLLSGDLLDRLRSIAKRWGFLTRDQLMTRAREIWESGWKPNVVESIAVQAVGSGADVEG